MKPNGKMMTQCLGLCLTGFQVHSKYFKLSDSGTGTGPLSHYGGWSVKQ